MAGPSYHAHTHLPGGPDPIYIDLPWCFLSGGGSIANGGANKYLDLQGGVAASFFTSHAAIYENALHNIGGTDYYGVKITQGGMYKIYLDGIWSGLSAAGKGTTSWTRFDGGPSSSALSTFQFGRAAALGNDTWDANVGGNVHTSTIEFLNIPGGRAAPHDGMNALDGTPNLEAYPVTIILFGKNTGTGAATLSPRLWIEKIGHTFVSDAGAFG